MGLLSIFRSRTIQTVEWTDSSAATLVHRFGTDNRRIGMGARLTVRESQTAVFVAEGGKVADSFGPGRYNLSTKNLPVLAALESWRYGRNSPFAADVYFINMRLFTGLKWTTTSPVVVRDGTGGFVRLRASGTFAFKISDAEALLKGIFAANRIYETAYIVGQLKGTLVSFLADVIGNSGIPPLDLEDYCEELGEQAENIARERLASSGFELSAFVIDAVTVLNDGERVGAAERNTAQSGTETWRCPCGYVPAPGMKFCPECGSAVKKPQWCAGCGYEIGPEMKFCPGCGRKSYSG